MPFPAQHAIPKGFNPEAYLSPEGPAGAGPSEDAKAAVGGLAAQAAADRAARIAETFGSLGPGFVQTYETTHRAASDLFTAVGERPPVYDDPHLVEQLTSLESTFRLYESLGLVPDLILAPEHRPLAWWQDMGGKLETSPLNPTKPDGSKIFQNNSLWVADEVRDDWNTLTGARPGSPTWNLHVISGLDRPKVVSVTSFGYTDSNNTEPSGETNTLLTQLGMPLVPERKSKRFGSTPDPVQPDIHPTIESYITQQWTRIISGKGPIDASTWSWLKGQLSSGYLPAGFWNPGLGRVCVGWLLPGYRVGSLGVRPSGRGKG